MTKGATLAERFDVLERWPKLFVQLERAQLESVLSALVAGRHEGWELAREDVADLVRHARGDVSIEGYKAKALAKANRLDN